MNLHRNQKYFSKCGFIQTYCSHSSLHSSVFLYTRKTWVWNYPLIFSFVCTNLCVCVCLQVSVLACTCVAICNYCTIPTGLSWMMILWSFCWEYSTLENSPETAETSICVHLLVCLFSHWTAAVVSGCLASLLQPSADMLPWCFGVRPDKEARQVMSAAQCSVSSYANPSV